MNSSKNATIFFYYLCHSILLWYSLFIHSSLHRLIWVLIQIEEAHPCDIICTSSCNTYTIQLALYSYRIVKLFFFDCTLIRKLSKLSYTATFQFYVCIVFIQNYTVLRQNSKHRIEKSQFVCLIEMKPRKIQQFVIIIIEYFCVCLLLFCFLFYGMIYCLIRNMVFNWLGFISSFV